MNDLDLEIEGLSKSIAEGSKKLIDKYSIRSRFLLLMASKAQSAEEAIRLMEEGRKDAQVITRLDTANQKHKDLLKAFDLAIEQAQRIAKG